MNTEKRVRDVARRQLDQRLEHIRGVTRALEAPAGGWIATLRTAYGMSQKDLARRIGVSQQSVSQLERREADGSATLHALEQAAEALGGQLVYGIVPARPIEALIEERALHLARRMTDSVRHTMRLEDQEPSADLDDRTRALARELKSSPARLWASSLDE